MKNQLVESFVTNARKSGADCIVAVTEDGLQAAIQRVVDHENLIYCPRQTSLEQSIVIPKSLETTDVFEASVAVEEAPWAIAETGSIVCLGATREQLRTSLLPEHHVALVKAGNICETFLDFVKNLCELPRNITLITGPSRTADIEKTLVLGMHGPRCVTVVVIQY